MDINLIPERQGIYLFLIPSLKVGYVGSSNNLKRRYLQHIEGNKGGNKVIKRIIDRNETVEYLILEFCDGYSTTDLKLIESNWIQHYKHKGLNLLNKSEPKTEPIYGEPKAVLAYDKDTLEFKGEWPSGYQAEKDLGCTQGAISHAILEGKQLKSNTYRLTAKSYFWFFKDGFSTEALFSKKERYELAKLNCKNKRAKVAGKARCKRTIQKTKENNIVCIWESASEASRKTGIYRRNISACASGKLKTAGGYIWEYAEESETIN